MMTLEQLEQRQRELAEQQRQLADEIKAMREAESAPKLWRPKDGDPVFHAMSDGITHKSVFDQKCTIAAEYLKQGSIFPTRELAEQAAAKHKIINKMILAAHAVDPGYEFKVGRDNYFIVIAREYESVQRVWNTNRHIDPLVPCVSTREKAEQMIKLMQEGE